METQKDRTIKIASVGVGLIGKERLAAIQKLIDQGRSIKICGIHDPYCRDKKEIERKFNVKFYDALDELFDLKPDWVFIAVPHDVSVDIVTQSLRRGFNVLVEKPLGRSLKEAKMLSDYAIHPDQLWVGFNYRFFDGVSKAIKDFKKSKFGKIISVNMILGHGCCPENKKEWKLDPVRAGGGCLIDPGIHFLDLCRILANDRLKIKSGVKWEGFWKTGIEEECHFFLEGEGFFINLQISIVRWRSTFRIEINGENGYGIISGRNRSYGRQTYIYGPRWGWKAGTSQIDSERLIVETSGDDVFVKEIDALLFPEKGSFIKPCSAYEAVRNIEILEECRKVL